MAKNAVSWAKQNKLMRTNQVHGAEEYRIPTMETFKHKDQEKLTTRAITGAVMKDQCSLMQRMQQHISCGIMSLVVP